MADFGHRLETTVQRHPVGDHHYAVVFLDAALHDALALKEQAPPPWLRN